MDRLTRHPGTRLARGQANRGGTSSVNIRKALVYALIALAVAAGAAACGKSHPAGGARASALATSSQGQAVRSDLKKDAAQCQPRGTTSLAWLVQLLSRKSARDALYGCAGVAKSERPKTGRCVVQAAERAVSTGGSAAVRETNGINELNGCVR
jgi:hypothetical protein